MASKERLYDLVEPLIKQMDPERAHDWAIWTLEQISRSELGVRAIEWLCANGAMDRLRCEVAGIQFENPLFLAAGFDKDGRAVGALEALGFGSIEVGTVVRFAQPGNEKPRIQRLGGGSLYNKMGFPSRGADQVLSNLYRGKSVRPLGVSIGVNKDRLQYHEEDLEYMAYLLSQACDYLVVNVSSPNTAGLRGLLSRGHVSRILEAIDGGLGQKRRCKGVFLKLSPDMDLKQIDEVLVACVDHQALGVVATNTTSDPAIKAELGIGEESLGGVSGPGLRNAANRVIAHVFGETGGRVPIIGSGGVVDLETALEKIALGATALSVYSGFVKEGPYWPSNLLREISEWMANEGVSDLSQIRGNSV